MNEKKTNNQVYYNQGGGDSQYTPKHGVELLLPYIQHLKEKIIWCPFDTQESWFVQILQEQGFNIVYSHIDTGQDFFEYEPQQWDVIISNPPYTKKTKYIERCISFNKPFCLLLPGNTISDALWNKLFEGIENELGILIPRKRMRFYNALTGETGKQPTFKACYFGRNIFNQQLILTQD